MAMGRKKYVEIFIDEKGKDFIREILKDMGVRFIEKKKKFIVFTEDFGEIVEKIVEKRKSTKA